MKIFVSNTVLPGRTVVSDDDKERSVDLSEPVQLVFVDGKATMKVFRQLYLAGIDAYFVVKNLEQFAFKMRLFRNLELNVISRGSLGPDRDIPKEVLCIFGAKRAADIGGRLGEMVERYMALERKLRGAAADGRAVARGVEVSFRPRIFEAIRSSLENSSLYKSKDTVSHRIFGLLKDGKRTIAEIEQIGRTADSIHKTLKSMMHAGIVVKKDEHFLLSEMFC